MKAWRLLATMGLMVAFPACDGAAPTESSDEALTQSTTGVLTMAPKLGFGSTVTKAVSGDELNVYKLKLAAGDRFTIEKKMTKGSAEPDFTLFADGAAALKSESFTREASLLSKSYFVPKDGNYFLGVRLRNKSGSGEYALSVTCTGGTCNGASDVAKAVKSLQSLFTPGRHRQTPVKASTPLPMVKEYVNAIYTKDEAAEYQFSQGSVVNQFFEAGTIDAAHAKNWLVTTLLDQLEGNVSEKEADKQVTLAESSIDKIAALGASFGFDGERNTDCGTTLLVLDTKDHVVYDIDFNQCLP